MNSFSFMPFEVRSHGGYYTRGFTSDENINKLICIHGGPGLTCDYFEHFPEMLKELDVQTIVYDQLGSFHSDRPGGDFQWSIDVFVQQLEQILNFHNCSSVNTILLGHSWGAVIALEHILQFPGRVAGMIMSNAYFSISGYNSGLRKIFNSFPTDVKERLTELKAEGFGHPDFQDIVNSYYFPVYMCRKNPWPEHLQNAVSHFDLEIFNKLGGGDIFHIGGLQQNWDKTQESMIFDLPVLCITGKFDPAYDDLIENYKLVKNSILHICENGGHFSMLDDMDSYFPSVRKFIQQVLK